MRGWDKDTDNVMMLENGYDFMGFSGFVSTNIPPSVAVEHGQKIKADLILIYDRQINEGDRASQFKQARRKAIEEKRVKDFGKVTEIEITEDDLVDPTTGEFYKTDTVIEFRWDFTVKKFIPLRTRWDKTVNPKKHGNFSKVACDIWNNINNPIEKEYLLKFYLLYKINKL